MNFQRTLTSYFIQLWTAPDAGEGSKTPFRAAEESAALSVNSGTSPIQTLSMPHHSTLIFSVSHLPGQLLQCAGAVSILLFITVNLLFKPNSAFQGSGAAAEISFHNV